MDWKVLRETTDHLELCKTIMKDYLITKSFKELKNKYGVSHSTITYFLNARSKLFDREAKKLYREMKAVKKNKRLKNVEKEPKKIAIRENPYFKHLNNFPKVITYEDFLNRVSRYETYNLTTNDWLKAAEDKGIKVEGLKHFKWCQI